MDIAALMEAFDNFTEAGDYTGAEDLLLGNLDHFPKHLGFLHFQLGQLYVRWNKMTSAVQHLSYAAEHSHLRSDEMLTLQIVQELKKARRMQAEQTP